jgi:exodeoxyribonuclease V gamma subunit
LIRLCYSNRTEELVDVLAEDLAAARPGAAAIFEPAPLVVPSPQVEAYVKMGLARRNGVVVNVAGRYLRRFLVEVAAATAPEVAIVERAAVQGELLALFHDAARLAAPDLEPVRDYLSAGGEAPDAIDLRRFQLSAELAGLFDDYAFSRPEMLAGWRGCELEAGLDEPLQRWQRALWLALFDARGGAFAVRARAEGRRYLTLPDFFEGLAPGTLRTPARAVFLFGISYVARLYRRIFAALGEVCALSIYTLNPCREFWEDLEAGRRADRARFPRRGQPEQLTFSEGSLFGTDPDGDSPALSLWARPGRENIRLLNQLSDCDFVSRFRDPVGSARPTLLARLQQDILDRTPARRGKDRPAQLAQLSIDDCAADDSIAVTPCPDPRRELETIAAEIWRLVGREQEPLRFSDIAILVPASCAETYLPLAAAVLREASDLPAVVLDAPLGGASRVPEAVGLLLALPLGPLGRQDLLRLCMHPAVAARFPEADPEDWLWLCEALDIVHGADRDDHSGTYVDGDLFNWDQGLKRLALGSFLSGARSGEARAFPLPGGRYLPAELSAEIEESAHGMAILARALIGFAAGARREQRTVVEWVALLRRTITETIVARSPDDEEALVRALAALEQVAEAAPRDLRVGYRIACELGSAALADLPARRAPTGGVVVSTFAPARMLPFRVVFAAGMGERAFPGSDRAGALDLRGGRRLPGDVSPREHDQYLFLEMLLGARERLHLSYVDRDPVTGEEMASASTVRELVELLEAGYPGAGAALARPAPPAARHDDEQACAIMPAAARERRAARLGGSLRAALGGRTAPDWRELREHLAPQALAAVGPVLGWSAPPAAAPAHAGGAADAGAPGRRLTMTQLLRFLQCPLQGSARALLPFGDDDSEDAADAAYREHEDFDVERLRALPLLRDSLAAAFAIDPAWADAALARAYDDLADMAALDGTLPAGPFRTAARERHLELLRSWREVLGRLGGPKGLALAAPPAPIWIGHAPEHRREVEILPAPRLDLFDGAAVELHGATLPTTVLAGLPTSIVLAGGSVRNRSERDFLRGWIDHVTLAAAGQPAPEGRRVLVLRPGAADGKSLEEVRLDPIAPAAARDYLARLGAELLAGVHPYFLPCEAVLGWWKKGAPRPPLVDYTLMLRDDEWTRFTSDWGPVPDARRYPTPPEAEAVAMAERRFGPFFATRSDRRPRES